MYSSTRIIDSRMALGPAESYVRSNSSPTEVVQGRYLRPEDVGKTMDIEPITFQTLNGGLGVWLIDVLHGRAVIESPDTEFHEIKAYRRLSWKIRVSTYSLCSTIANVMMHDSGQVTCISQSGLRTSSSPIAATTVVDLTLVSRF